MKSSITQLLILVLSAGALTACGDFSHRFSAYDANSDYNNRRTSQSAAAGDGFEVFKTGLYKFVTDKGCAQCHGDVVNPKFANSDPQTAYDAASQLVDFDSPATSRLVRYAGNSHCGVIACSDAANSGIVEQLLIEWATAEKAVVQPVDPTQPVKNSFQTESKSVPGNLPSLMANPVVMRFALSKLQPQMSSVSSAILEIEIQMANATHYRISRPKIVGNSAAISLDSLHVFVKSASDSGLGLEDTNQGSLWVNSPVTLQPTSLPGNLPTGPLTVGILHNNAIQLPALSSSDQLTIVIDSLK
ncbi:MAG: hypothetical protein AB7F86_11615 [Bdellovibrionales bacterium]